MITKKEKEEKNQRTKRNSRTLNNTDENRRNYQSDYHQPPGKPNKHPPSKLSKTIKIIYANVNGITSKQTCIDNICQNEKPHITAFTETKTNILPPITDYTWKTSHKTNRRGGGVAIASRNDIKNKVRENSNTQLGMRDMEIAWVTLDASNRTQIHVGIFYGKQETHNINETQREYDELVTQIMEKKRTGEIILLGDFNAKLEIKEGNNMIQDVTRNGKLLCQLLKVTKLIPANIQDNNNKWTRVNRHNPNEKSIIDYILISEGIQEMKHDIYTDEEGLLKIQGKHQSDHNLMMITLELPMQKSKQKINKWNKLDDTCKWDAFNQELDKEYKKMNDPTYEESYNLIYKTLVKIIRKRTITLTGKPRTPESIKHLASTKKEQKKLFNTECRINGPDKAKLWNDLKTTIIKINQELTQIKNQKIRKITEQLTKEGGSKSKRFWKIRKNNTNQGKAEPHDLITEENTRVTNPQETRQYIAEYYENLYKAREPRPNFRNHSKKIAQENTNYEIITSNLPKMEEITIKELETAIKIMKKGKASGPDDIPNEIFIYANKQTKQIYCKILNKIITTENIPKQWLENTITRFYKGKGTKGKCSSERGITLSSNFGKLFERIINNRIQNQINITDEQGGGRSKRSTVDHINILKSIITKNE